MARGRHVRRTGLLVWLFATSVEPSQRSWRDVHAHSLVLLSDQVRTLQTELPQLRAQQERAAAAAALSERRATRLEEQLAAAQAEIGELRGELTALREELRGEVAALREELVWAFAERRHAAADAGAGTAVRPVASAG